MKTLRPSAPLLRLATILLVLTAIAVPYAAPAAADSGHEPAAKQEESGAAVPQRPLERVPLGGVETRAPRPSGSPSPIPLPPDNRRPVTDVFQKGTFFQDLGSGLTPLDLENPIEHLQADGEGVVTPEGRYELRDNVRMVQGGTEFGTDLFVRDKRERYIEATGNVRLSQEESLLTADRVRYTSPPPGEEVAPFEAVIQQPAQRRGTVEAECLDIIEPGRQLQAGRLRYDFGAGTGEASEVRGRAGIYYFGARELEVLGPNSVNAQDVWISTCDHDPPHYSVYLTELQVREGQPILGEDARLQLGKKDTPLYWPKWSHSPNQEGGLSFDFDSGRAAQLGYYLNFGQRFAVSPYADLGIRLFPTEKEGVGFGIDSDYNYMDMPASWLFRSQGTFRSLYTTQDRGYTEFYHRQEVTEDAVLLLQSEQWFDRDFVKDFYYDLYRNRTQPRTFASLTWTQPDYIVTGTVRATTNDWVTETERLPEFGFHLFERPLMPNLYFTYDGIAGYNEREPSGTAAGRWVNVARLSYDLELGEALNLVPFYEVEATAYTRQRVEDESDVLFANTVGMTLQTRLHKVLPGAFGFESFRHLVMPSITYSYRPQPTMDPEDTPRFDAYDNAYGRSRIEAKLANVLLGRDAASGATWQVARLTLYAGADLWNASRKSDDYEMELDVRPRPWWGLQVAAEHHGTNDNVDLDEPFILQRLFLQRFEELFDRPYNPEASYQYNAQYGDYDRLLSFLYYDNTADGGRFNGRLGLAYTETQGRVFNREVLYGMGYQLGKKWSLAFEHRYDFERDELTRQTYEVRRNLHCWEGALQFRERESGWDVSVVMNIAAFPGTKVSF